MRNLDFASILEEKMRQKLDPVEDSQSPPSYFETLFTEEFVSILGVKLTSANAKSGANVYKRAAHKNWDKDNSKNQSDAQFPHSEQAAQIEVDGSPTLTIENLNLEQKIALERLIQMGALQLDRTHLKLRDLKKCFRKLARQHHPDTGSQGEEFLNLVTYYQLLLSAFN